MEQNILIPLLLSLFAGLATLIGFLITFVAKHTNKKLLSFALGLSAGVMVYIAFAEILHDAQGLLEGAYGTKKGMLLAAIFFFGGMLLIGIIDRLVPSFENPHEARMIENPGEGIPDRAKLKKMGVMTALVIGIHNFPEGIATFMAALDNPELGIAIAVAIAIHNIPEGMAVSIPIYYLTKSKKKAFRITLISGLAEPLGALVAYLVLMPFLSPVVMGAVFAAVAGIMVFISFDELFPAAREYGEHHVAIYGLVAGMAIMALSLVLMC